MAVNQQLSLKWNNHSMSFGQFLKDLCFNESYSDATLVCQDMYYPVHKMVLSNSSLYFKSIFDHAPCKHPFIVLKDIQPKDMELLLKFIYHGEVNASQVDLPAILDGAEYLRIEGLSVYDGNEGQSGNFPRTARKRGKKRKSVTQGQKKLKKGNFATVDFEHLEPDTILHSENNGDHVTNAVETEEEGARDNQPISTTQSGGDDSTPSKVGGEFFCRRCNYSSRKSFNISRHIMRNHTGEKPHACHLCSYRSVETSQLTNHIKRIHSGSKPFICCRCSFGTITLRNLKRHLKLHEKDELGEEFQSHGLNQTHEENEENWLHGVSQLHEENKLHEEDQFHDKNQHKESELQEENQHEENNLREEKQSKQNELYEEKQSKQNELHEENPFPQENKFLEDDKLTEEDQNRASEEGSSQIHSAEEAACISPTYNTSHFMTHTDHNRSQTYPS